VKSQHKLSLYAFMLVVVMCVTLLGYSVRR